MRLLEKLLPVVGTLERYSKPDLRGDLVAGLTTAVMLIPQGMGYAMLAGLPPIYGLYASFLPLAVYGLLGTSRQLAVGPVAMVSLLVVAGVGGLAEPGSPLFIEYAILLALMVGVLQLSMGLARLGFAVNFLSHPVISGFTSAAALIIGFSQLKHVLGFDIARSHHVHHTLLRAMSGIEQTNLTTLAIAVCCTLTLVVLERYSPLFPRALLVVGGSAAAVWALDLEARDVAVVGQVPDGLPALALPLFDWQAARSLLPMAVTIALVGFMESIAVAKRYARELKYPVDANRELVGLGLANVVGALFGSYPVTGGFSRTAVNAQAGAKTGLAGIVTALVVGITLIWLTPLFYYVPSAVLAVIIITAVVGLIDVAEVKHLWRVKRGDLAMLLLTFASTLGLGIEQGILVGVGASLAMLIFNSTRPHVAVLGRLPGTEVYRNVKRHPHAEVTPGVLALRLDAQIYFGNINFLKETLDSLERDTGEALHAVVLDASGINQLDASGDTALGEIFDGYRARGVELLLSNVKGPVRDVLERSGLMARLGSERMFLSTGDAMCRARSLAADGSAAEAPRTVARRGTVSSAAGPNDPLPRP